MSNRDRSRQRTFGSTPAPSEPGAAPQPGPAEDADLDAPLEGPAAETTAPEPGAVHPAAHPESVLEHREDTSTVSAPEAPAAEVAAPAQPAAATLTVDARAAEVVAKYPRLQPAVEEMQRRFHAELDRQVREHSQSKVIKDNMTQAYRVTETCQALVSGHRKTFAKGLVIRTSAFGVATISRLLKEGLPLEPVLDQ